MSKIQKALGRLRDDDNRPNSGDIAEANERKIADADRAKGKGVDQHRSIRRFPRSASSKGIDGAKFPELTIRVEMSSLYEHGLTYEYGDLDLLGQQFRRIKRPILSIGFRSIDAGVQNANVIMVTSALPKSGKTFCSYNLAVSIARERDIGAVLVDADVLKPNISSAFGVADRIGLIDYLLDPEISLDDILIGTNIHDVVIVPAGQQHAEATELLASRRMEDFVTEMSRRLSDWAIVVDTPPLLLTNEAHVLADHMGQIVFVVEAGVTSYESVTNALESLNRDKPINAIMNKARGASFDPYALGYSGGYYGYYSVPGDRYTGD